MKEEHESKRPNQNQSLGSESLCRDLAPGRTHSMQLFLREDSGTNDTSMPGRALNEQAIGDKLELCMMIMNCLCLIICILLQNAEKNHIKALFLPILLKF